VFFVKKLQKKSGNAFLTLTSSKTGSKREIMVCEEQWLDENYYNALKGLSEKTYSYLFIRTSLLV